MALLLDNQDISKFNLASLRNQISIVDQNTTLFDDTVLNNIKYANQRPLMKKSLKLQNNQCVMSL